MTVTVCEDDMGNNVTVCQDIYRTHIISLINRPAARQSGREAQYKQEAGQQQENCSEETVDNQGYCGEWEGGFHFILQTK